VVVLAVTAGFERAEQGDDLHLLRRTDFLHLLRITDDERVAILGVVEVVIAIHIGQDGPLGLYRTLFAARQQDKTGRSCKHEHQS